MTIFSSKKKAQPTLTQQHALAEAKAQRALGVFRTAAAEVSSAAGEHAKVANAAGEQAAYLNALQQSAAGAAEAKTRQAEAILNLVQ